MYINGGVKKKRYQRWGEKCNNFFGNFFIILASTTNFVQNLNLLWPTKISLKTLFFLAKQYVLFVGEVKSFFFTQCWRLRFNLKHTMLLLQMISDCCKGVCKWLAHDFKTCSWVLQMTNGFAHGKCKWLLMDNFALVTTMTPIGNDWFLVKFDRNS